MKFVTVSIDNDNYYRYNRLEICLRSFYEKQIFSNSYFSYVYSF